MQILVIGDIHCKPDILDRALKIKGWDKAVFLGDACDDWGATQLDNINTLNKLVEIKKEYGEKFIWLIGNHDWAYYDPSIKLSGHIYVGAENCYSILTENKSLWDLVYFHDNYIFSHAGFDADFVKFTEGISLEEMKEIKGEENPVNMVGRACGGYDPSPSFLWARPEEISPLPPMGDKEIIQIVGHTPVKGVVRYDNLVVCDTFSTTPQGDNLGDCSLLLLDTDTNKMEVVDLNGNHLYKIN